MKKNRIVTIKIFIAAFAVFFSVRAGGEMTSDTIIAVVNKDVITLKEFHEYLGAIYLQLSSEGRSETEIKDAISRYEKEGIQRLIDDKLLLDEANRKGLTIRDKAVDGQIKKIKESYPSHDEFLRALGKEGLTFTELKKRITDQLKVKYIVEMEVKSKIFVNPNEVTEYYQKNINDFNKPERADLDSIFIPLGGDAALAEKKAKEASNRIKKGEDFHEVAKNYSSLPSVGIVERGQLVAAIEQAVFSIKEGETTGPIKTDNGIFIFKLKKKYPKELASLDEAKEQIYSRLFTQKFRKRLSLWLEGLKSKAYVEIKG